MADGTKIYNVVSTPDLTTNGLLKTSGGDGTLTIANLRDIVQTISATGQVADITSTNFTNAGSAGLYRLSYYLVDTTADATAGAVSLSITYTDAGGAKTVTSSAVILTATTAYTQGVIYIQQTSGTLAYSTGHTGLLGAATYDLYITLERLN